MYAHLNPHPPYLDEHHEGAGEEGHVDERAEGDEPPQRRALRQQRLLIVDVVCAMVFV